jgi:hypothetical protein
MAAALLLSEPGTVHFHGHALGRAISGFRYG